MMLEMVYLLICLIFHASAALIDLSHPMNENSTNWPLENFKRFKLTPFFEYRVEELGVYAASKNIEFTEHVGTHMDAPRHFGEVSWDTASIPVQNLIVPVVKLDVREKCSQNRDYEVTVQDLEEWKEQHGEVPHGAAVILETGWGEKYGDWLEYFGTARDTKAADFNLTLWSSEIHFPGFSAELASALVTNYTISGIGTDCASLDPAVSHTFAAHLTVMTLNKWGLENLCCLRDVPEKGATLMAFPPKIAESTGFPVRVIVDTDSMHAYRLHQGTGGAGCTGVNSAVRLPSQLTLSVILFSLYFYM